MNIYWEEHDSADERPKHWSEGLEENGSVDLSNAVMNDTESSFVTDIKLPPQPVGGYDITGNGGGNGSCMFMFLKKPNWFHRTCTRFFLGWKWVDGNGLNKKVKK